MHQYNTRANHQFKMDQLEQENHEPIEEVARLTNLMESLMTSQSQATLVPATLQQRTIISEITSTLVSVAPANQPVQSMSVGFPWGMPQNYVPRVMLLPLLLY